MADICELIVMQFLDGLKKRSFYIYFYSHKLDSLEFKSWKFFEQKVLFAYSHA